jgi:Secretion system C-terminal sorting domain
MKKHYILLCAGLLSANLLQAQSGMSAEQAPDIKPAQPANNISSVTPWQLNFSFDLTVSGIAGGNAGVAATGTEYWVSRWNSDSIFTLDLNGVKTDGFTIPGVTGLRSMTTDGTNIYAGANTAEIIVIDPTTKTLLSTIPVSIPNVRYCSYDATANSGAGGFWIGSYATDITLVDMTGAVLTTIAPSSHGLTASYGMTIDNASPGGPFLWSFHQTASGTNAADIFQVEVATGFQTGVMHDVTTDLGTPGNLAGGIYFVASPLSLIGILQGNPTGAATNYLFSYDVNLTGISENAANPAFVSVYPNPATDVVNVGVKRTNNDPMQIQIIDATGKIVSESNNVGVSNIYNLSKYPAGIYTVKVTHNGSIHTATIVHN